MISGQREAPIAHKAVTMEGKKLLSRHMEYGTNYLKEVRKYNMTLSWINGK